MKMRKGFFVAILLFVSAILLMNACAPEATPTEEVCPTEAVESPT